MGTATARRYARGFSPIVAFADNAQPDVAALAPHCAVDEHVYCAGWRSPVPPGWQLHAEGCYLQMVWQGADTAPGPGSGAGGDIVVLGPHHVERMCALAWATNPGPFDTRTREMGEYVGLFDGERLVAMAGERFRAGVLQEVSAVCTDPAYQGRGLARRLVQHLVRRQRARALTPFLHVAQANSRATALYEGLGFRAVQEIPIRVLSRLG